MLSTMIAVFKKKKTMSESSVPASDDNLRPKKKKKGAASIICKWGGYKRSDLQLSPIFYKIYKETLVKMEINPFHHLRQKHSIDYNQPIEACEEEIRAAGDSTGSCWSTR